ncbi:MAG: hypothetical protein ACI4CS_08140 [Candidatus Weimeria sp.]
MDNSENTTDYRSLIKKLHDEDALVTELPKLVLKLYTEGEDICPVGEAVDELGFWDEWHKAEAMEKMREEEGLVSYDGLGVAELMNRVCQVTLIEKDASENFDAVIGDGIKLLIFTTSRSFLTQFILSDIAVRTGCTEDLYRTVKQGKEDIYIQVKEYGYEDDSEEMESIRKINILKKIL